MVPLNWKSEVSARAQTAISQSYNWLTKFLMGKNQLIPFQLPGIMLSSKLHWEYPLTNEVDG